MRFPFKPKFIDSLAPCVLALAFACSPGATTGDGGSGDNDASAGDEGGSATMPSSFESCEPPFDVDCPNGEACLALAVGTACARPCDPNAENPDCAAVEANDNNGAVAACEPVQGSATEGYCAARVDHFEECRFDLGCKEGALCLSRSLAMPPRCVPVCDAGDYDVEAVISCPNLPAKLSGQATTCTPVILGPGDVPDISLCAREVAAGEACDQAARTCNLDDGRADTAPGDEPASFNAPDNGALACLPTADGAFCLRLCQVENGGAQASCECPAEDGLCEDPAAGWQCSTWPELNTNLMGCWPG